MKTSPPVLLYGLSLLLLSGAWQGSSSLTCVFESMEIVTCNWTQRRNATEAQCRLTGHVESNYKPRYSIRSPSPSQTCRLHDRGTATRSCRLIFDQEIYSVTVSDYFRLVVSCRGREMDSRRIRAFENLQLWPPHNVQMQSSRKPSYNLTWQLSNVSDYLKGQLEYEVRYDQPDNPDKAATILPITNDQQWVEIETLSPGTVHEAAVRVKVQDSSGYKSIWSDWSTVVKWRTYPKEPPLHIFVPVLLALGISLIFIVLITTGLLVKTGIPKRLQKVLKIHLPDPAKFFPSLTAIHGGDVQKWLSCPLSTDSFHVVSASPDVSVLEILQKDNQDPCLLPKEYLTHGTHETSADSLSSCFVNHGYFLFHHLHSLEVEPCQVYFTFDPFAQENSGSEDGDSYQVLCTTGDHLPLPSYSLTEGQEDVSLLQEMKEPTQKVHQTISSPSTGRAPPVSAVEQDENQKESKAIVLVPVSSPPSATDVSSVHKQPSSTADEMEAIADVATHTNCTGASTSSFLHPAVQNEGGVSDFCRTAPSIQFPNSEAYLSLRELQSQYCHLSV